jgi:hypothetical protein
MKILDIFEISIKDIDKKFLMENENNKKKSL